MYKRLRFILLIIFFHSMLFAKISITNTVPDIIDASASIKAFEIKLSIEDIEDISLGDTVEINLPRNLPNLSLQDIDDGKLYVQYSFKNSLDEDYKNAPGIKVSVYEHTISIKFTSKIQTFQKNDTYESIVQMSNNDVILFNISANKDLVNQAGVQYEDTGAIEIKSSSRVLALINDTSPIITTPLELKVTNPSVIFDKKGLGATSNPKFLFYSKGGLPKDTRIEIVFPDGFNIGSLHLLDNYILVNKRQTSDAFTDGQKLSFKLNNDISQEDIEINIISYRIINTTNSSIKPFKINVYRNDEIYTIYSVYPMGKNSNTYFVNHSYDEYSLKDEIHIEFSKSISVVHFNEDDIGLQGSKDGRTFGANYQLEPTNASYGFASTFKIILSSDTNLTRGLNINVSKNAIITKDGYKALDDIVFKVPNINKTKPVKTKKTLLQTHTKLFASSDIDMLYEALDDVLPDRATFNDIIFNDIDRDGKYSKDDTLILTFSQPIYSPNIDISSIVSISGDVNFGIDASIIRYSPTNSASSVAIYHNQYIVKIGFSPSLQSNDIFAFNRTKILAENGSIPTYDVLFSPLPNLDPPTQGNELLVFEDNDNNEVYSLGDKLFVQFDQPIKSLSKNRLSLLSGDKLDAEYIIPKNTVEGYSAKMIIKLGANTQLKANDYLLIPKSDIINKHGIRADIRGYMQFRVPGLNRARIDNASFNFLSNFILLTFNGSLVQINQNEILKKIMIINNEKEQSLESLKESVISFEQQNNTISFTLSKDFISSLSEAKIRIIIPEGTVALASSLRLNREISVDFYTTISMKNLLPDVWNLVAIEDKMVDTNINNIKATQKVNDVYSFDIATNGWLNSNDTIVQRGIAIWINPKEKMIDNILAISPKEKFTQKTTLLNYILHMKNDVGSYLGHSVKNCDTDESFELSSTKPIVLENIKVQFITYNADTKIYNDKITSIKPCTGFLVFKKEKP